MDNLSFFKNMLYHHPTRVATSLILGTAAVYFPASWLGLSDQNALIIGVLLSSFMFYNGAMQAARICHNDFVEAHHHHLN